MNNYYATFRLFNNILLRYDTRIYWNDNIHNKFNGKCIGTFYLKNPGSSQPTEIDKWSTLDLNNDKVLPYLRNVLLKLKNVFQDQINDNDYFQVLNLFPVVNNDLYEAYKRFEEIKKNNINVIEKIKNKSLFVYFGWGSENYLSDLREYHVNNNQYPSNSKIFFIEYKKNNYSKIFNGFPSNNSRPKHIQGLPKILLEPYIIKILKDIFFFKNR